jgi:uncharacterized protein
MPSDAQWQCVNVRRPIIVVERSIDEGTQWAVFEPNDRQRWVRATVVIRDFLRSHWHLGAWFGRSGDAALIVHCDATTMTQDDTDHGRRLGAIGVAPGGPAEFVVFRIAQPTACAQR